MINEIDIQYLDTPYGELVLGSIGDELCLCDWRYRKMREAVDNRLKRILRAEFVERPNETTRQAEKELVEYFRRERKDFDVPLRTAGTTFQERVWDALMEIPFGETTSYAQLAESIGSSKSVRAVASANGANALAIIIPCHRVIGSNGRLVGYAGGLNAKEKLLKLEQDLFSPSDRQ